MISLRSSGYQHICIDINSKVVHIKLYTTKIPTSSADMRNDKVLPFYKQYGPLVLVRPTGIAYSDCVAPAVLRASDRQMRPARPMKCESVVTKSTQADGTQVTRTRQNCASS
ncbi:MAG TPA: hypothetical protein DD666_19670 [Advenella kashmirensis]|uniref:Uncharacterized protein n=1 Tax=Advenella kashmirensis TaxID=310575 RepID=A0A356LKU8_9BURK|nr:hypothetical protein [Advenella kashmirensis]